MKGKFVKDVTNYSNFELRRHFNSKTKSILLHLPPTSTNESLDLMSTVTTANGQDSHCCCWTVAVTVGFRLLSLLLDSHCCHYSWFTLLPLQLDSHYCHYSWIHTVSVTVGFTLLPLQFDSHCCHYSLLHTVAMTVGFTFLPLQFHSHCRRILHW